MKIAFDVDVLAKQMSINDYVHKVADWGYKYIEQSPHPRINPFYKHPLFSKECEEEYRRALRETGVEISSFIVVYRWSGPTEEQRQHAVANWKRMIEIAVNMGVPVINTEFSGDPNQQEICNGMFYKSMEELLPIIEREGLRVEIQSHPYDFCELNDETCDIVKSFRSKNLGYVYSASHGFFYDQVSQRCFDREICADCFYADCPLHGSSAVVRFIIQAGSHFIQIALVIAIF
nr:sugar phosphate isomerase/epimerase [uncultured Agathobaculum sp.]